jgi:hypothetical protein
MFIGHTCQPVSGALLRGTVICDAPVVDYLNVAFFLTNLPSTHRYLNISRGSAWPLIVTFLSTVPCEVTRLSAKEACEDFPLSVPLDGSSWISSFPASSYSLLVSISSREEVFCFGHPGPCSSWGGVHRILITLGIPPLIVERSPGGNRWHFLGFEMIRSVFHVNINSLLFNCCRSPLLVCCGLWESS